MLRLIFGALMLGPLTTGLRDYSPMTNFFFLLQEKKSTPEEKVRPEDEEEKSKVIYYHFCHFYLYFTCEFAYWWMSRGPSTPFKSVRNYMKVNSAKFIFHILIVVQLSVKLIRNLKSGIYVFCACVREIESYLPSEDIY